MKGVTSVSYTHLSIYTEKLCSFEEGVKKYYNYLKEQQENLS